MKGRNQGRLVTNMTSYAALQIVNMLVGLFLPRLYLAVYGSEVNGVISTANSFISYFSYLEAGIGLTLIHSLFKPLAENNTEQTNGILSYSQKQYRRISGVYFACIRHRCIWCSRLFHYGEVSRSVNRRSKRICYLECVYCA